MIVFFLILGGLPSQIKLKIILLILSIRDLDTVSNELQYMSLAFPPLFWVKKEEMTEGKMADRASKSRHPPPPPPPSPS